jgi:hypothetical protein
VSGSNQIQLSASSRGITDHFFCFTCDEYVWECDHLIEERLSASRISIEALCDAEITVNILKTITRRPRLDATGRPVVAVVYSPPGCRVIGLIHSTTTR